MNCERMNCIYVLKCTGCHKIYIGETNNLRHRIIYMKIMLQGIVG